MRFHFALRQWNMLNGIWRGWMRNFFHRKKKLQRRKRTVCFSSDGAIDCAVPTEEWETTQQTSGITKTKLKFFIVNKRREGIRRWQWRWIRCRSYLLIWSHFKLSLLLLHRFLSFLPRTGFGVDCKLLFDSAAFRDKERMLSRGDSIGNCAHPQKFLVLVCW